MGSVWDESLLQHGKSSNQFLVVADSEINSNRLMSYGVVKFEQLSLSGSSSATHLFSAYNAIAIRTIPKRWKLVKNYKICNNVHWIFFIINKETGKRVSKLTLSIY